MNHFYRAFTIAFVIFISTPLYAATIKSFASDGCSAFPDGNLQQRELWLNCCVQHDFTYWKGGTYQQRQAADTQLRKCVAKIGEPKIAALMLTGVRVGGSPFFPTSFRWGYGWPYPRFYGKLNQQETKEVSRILNQNEELRKLR